MYDNKMILSYCKNFDKIVNTDFIEGDNLSLQLVKIYKDFIFRANIHDQNDIRKVCDIDTVMGKYVDDYLFRKTLQHELLTVKVKRTAGDTIRFIVESIISIFRKYELESTRKIYVSRWI